MTSPTPASRVTTGVPHLDAILHGGLLAGQSYLVRGGPGTGKTTLGFHFLCAGRDLGEAGLLITLGESISQLQRNAEGLGFDLSRLSFLDLTPTPGFFAAAESYDLFSPADVDRDPMTQQIIQAVEDVRPSRIFVDSMTQFRYLNRDEFQFRKQTLSFLRYLSDVGATVLLSSEGSSEAEDLDLEHMTDGVIRLHGGTDGRTLTVSKLRGSDFRHGPHAMRLTARGIAVYPRLHAETYRPPRNGEPLTTGVTGLDQLLQGGLERGAVTLISGPSGVGKSTFGLLFMREAARRGERSVVYTFEEHAETLLRRCEALQIPVHRMIEGGTLSVVKIESLHLMPDEFAHLVREEVEERGAQIVMLDSLSGYRVSLNGLDLIRQVHALTRYLVNMGVTTLLVDETESIAGELKATDAGIAYLADTIVFLRYLEDEGQIRKAVGVLKKRTGDFEKTLRELEMGPHGVQAGPPLIGLQGLLSGGAAAG